MRIVEQYYLQKSGLTRLDLPRGSKVLSVAGGFALLTLWVEQHDYEDETQTRTFEVVGLSKPIQSEIRTYIGSAMFSSAGGVCHVYEVLNQQEQEP